MDWSFWDVLWTTFVVFLWITFLVIFFNVVLDIFRSHDLSGWMKAVWLVVLVVLPFLGLLVYVIARGSGMAQRAAKDQIQRADQLREAMGQAPGGAADQIAQAKQLLDSGAITPEEFEQIKAKALA